MIKVYKYIYTHTGFSLQKSPFSSSENRFFSRVSCPLFVDRARACPSLSWIQRHGRGIHVSKMGNGRSCHKKKIYLGGGFKHFLFALLLGEMIQFDEYFFDGLTPPTRYLLVSLKKNSIFFLKKISIIEFRAFFFPWKWVYTWSDGKGSHNFKL